MMSTPVSHGGRAPVAARPRRFPSVGPADLEQGPHCEDQHVREARATRDEPLNLLLHSSGSPVVFRLDNALDDAAPGPSADALSDAAVETTCPGAVHGR